MLGDYVACGNRDMYIPASTCTFGMLLRLSSDPYCSVEWMVHMLRD